MDIVAIGIAGAAGRMGQTLIRQIAGNPATKLAGAFDRPEGSAIGRDAGEAAGAGTLGVTIGDDPRPVFATADVVIDFSSPATIVRHAELAAQGKTALVVGTTGLDDTHFEALRRAARHTAVVQSFNMSVGVNLVAGLVRRAAAALGPEFDIEIVEMHHRLKVDAPSGTALLFGEAAAEGRGVNLKEMADRGRDGITGARARGHIGFAALRGGNVVGEHSVIFAADDERIEITHKAGDRALFARGAVHAAIWTHGRKPGYYRMTDVLGLND